MLGQFLGKYIGDMEREDQAREARRAYNQMLGINQEAYEDISGMYSPFTKYAGMGMDQLSDPNKFQTSMGNFDYKGDVNQFLDPSLAFQLQQGTRALDASAAAGGNLYSGAQQKELAQFGNNLGQQGYADAWQRMQGDRANKYKQFLDQFEARRMNDQQRYEQAKSMFGTGMGAIGNIAGARQNQAGNASNIAMMQGQTNAQLANKGWGDFLSNLTSPQNIAAMGKFI